MFMYAYKHVSVMLRVCVLEHSVHVHFQASVLWGIVLIVDKYQPILCLLVDHPPYINHTPGFSASTKL